MDPSLADLVCLHLSEAGNGDPPSSAASTPGIAAAIDVDAENVAVGGIARERGDVEVARRELTAALDRQRDGGGDLLACWALFELAALARDAGHEALAAEREAAATRLARDGSIRRFPGDLDPRIHGK